MPNKPATPQQLLAENEDLCLRLAQAEASLREMRSGGVDAMVISDVGGAQLFALKDVDQSFRLLVGEMSEGALTMTAEGVIVYANRHFAGMLKTPLEKVIGSTLRTWIGPGSQPILQSLLENGAGEERRAELVLAAANQSRAGLLRVIEDKTRAEEALRASQQMLKQTYDALDQAIFVVNPANRTVVACNTATTDVFGYQCDELIGRTTEFLHVDQARFEEFGRRLLSALEAAGSFHTEFQMRRKNGEIFFTEITVTQIRDDAGRRTGVVNVVRDITERKRAENDIRESEERFRGLVEQSIAGIYIIQDDKFAYVNQRFAEIVGYESAEELIGRDSLSLVIESDRSVVQDIRRRIESGVRSMSYGFTARRRDGSTVEVGIHSASATHRGRVAFIGLMQDISEKRRAEEEIQRYVEQLKTALMSTVGVATTMGEMRDPYTAGHQRRVAGIAVAIGAELGFDARRQEGLRVAGHLHDVGKITIPSEILSKPGKISAVEYQLIQGHSQAGYDVLKDVEFPWPVAEVALQHHERIDGSGYPQGLKGEAILLEARIMAVADVIEAMSSHRPYRPGLGIDKALAEIERGRGTAYDPAVTDACLRLFREKGYAISA